MAEWQGVYVVMLMGSILVPVALAVYAWLRRSTPGALPFVWFMGSAALTSLCYLGLATAPNSRLGFFWARLRFLSVGVLAVFATLFLMAYVGRNAWLKPRRYLWLFIIPAIIQIAVWINGWHHNLFTSWRLEDKGLLSVEISTFGFWYWLHAIYSYGIIAVAFGMLCVAYLRSKGVFRQQAALMIIGALVALVASLPSGLGVMEPPFNTVPLGVIATGLYFTWALFRFGLLDLTPVAHGTIFRSINDAAIVLDSRDRIVEINPAALRLFGKTEPEVIGQPVATVFAAGSDLAQWNSNVLDTQEFVALGSGEQIRSYELRTSPLNNRGEEIGRLILLQDITERKQAEEALRASEARFRLLIDALPTIVFIYQHGKVVYVNPAVEGVTGYTVDEIVGSDFGSLLSSEAQAIVEEGMKTFASGELEVKPYYEISIVARSGEPRTLHINLIPLDYDGEPALLGTALDVTGQRQSEQQRMELSMERERVQILTTFITQASHEFRTPLATINTSTYLLKNSTDPLIRQRHLQTIESQVKSISELVNALITMSRLDSGQAMQQTPVDLCQMVPDILTLRRAALETKNLRSVLDNNLQSMVLKADPVYLQMALECLIDNAIRFTADGGTITVRLDQTQDRAIIEIADTGSGIEEADLPNIFQRFYRGDKAGTTRGLGLGLPIAQTIINLHQGCIEVESEPGQGSTFRVALPMA